MAEKQDRRKSPSAARESSGSITVSDIKELIALMKANEIAELNLEQKDTKVHIVSTHAPVYQQPSYQHVMPMMQGMGVSGSSVAPPQPPAAAPAPPEAPATAQAEAARLDEEAPANVTTIHSPMVGTFYRAPAPDAAPFVKVGDSVKEDTTLCIIEAMKLMNEIKAEKKGRIYKILIENGVPVEYNQPLFLIEPE